MISKIALIFFLKNISTYEVDLDRGYEKRFYPEEKEDIIYL